MDKTKIVKIIFYLLFFSFLVLLFAEKAGYYDSKETKAKTLTEEQIKAFEQDIKDGKEIDIKDYVVNYEQNYSNKLSNNIYKASLELEKGVDKVIKFLFKQVSEVVEE